MLVHVHWRTIRAFRLDLFLCKILKTNRGIERDFDMSLAGLSKPYRGDRLIATQMLAFQGNDVPAAKSAQARIGRRRATPWHARQRSKHRTRDI